MFGWWRVWVFFAVFGLLVGISWQLSTSPGSSGSVKWASVFEPKKTSLNKQTTLLVGGDVMLGRTVMTTSQDKDDFVYPFREIADTLKSADITFVNLENPIVEKCPRHTTGFKFCAVPEMLEGLVFAGVDVVTIANNHIFNYGNAGVINTVKELGKSGIGVTGTQYAGLVIKNVDGTKFGFLGFDLVDKTTVSPEYLLATETADKKVDVLILGIHWGAEYKDFPAKSQRDTASKFISAGADVIVGSHPHWVQQLEYIDGKPVFWSLGNLVFDQMWSQRTRQGALGKLVFEGKSFKSVEVIPTYIENWAQPVVEK